MVKAIGKMEKANIAEWLLRRVVDHARASELVGDQLEAHPATGNLPFWVAIMRVFLAFSWRTIVAVTASPVAGLILASLFFVFVHSDTHYPSDPVEFAAFFRIKMYLYGISIVFWMATTISLVRYGWRDVRTGTGLAASVLCSLSTNFFAQKIPLGAIAVVSASFLAFSMVHSHRRRALGIFLSAVSAAWLVAFTSSRISFDPHSVFGKWQFVAAFVLMPIVESIIISSLSDRFIAPKGRPAALNPD